jgi:hypothetical protein
MGRYRGWPVVIMGTTGFDVTKFLAKLCEECVVPVSCNSDGGPNLTAKVVKDLWKIMASTTGSAQLQTHTKCQC